ncbi:MAG: helix-turn-helix transcriptional regulator [Eubacterium sp.]
MKKYTEHEIEKLTQSLPSIRKIAGWSSEELGELIGVTKQTISNIETRKSKMSKTQYIAIRTIIDYEIAEHPDNELLANVVYILLDSDDTKENEEKAKATIEMLDKTSKAAITSGAIAGVSAILAVLASPYVAPAINSAIERSSKWLKKILK